MSISPPIEADVLAQSSKLVEIKKQNKITKLNETNDEFMVTSLHYHSGMNSKSNLNSNIHHRINSNLMPKAHNISANKGFTSNLRNNNYTSKI